LSVGPVSNFVHNSRSPAIRDLRALLWSSIDNDDTRDLDQLVVAEPLVDAARAGDVNLTLCARRIPLWEYSSI
jgi:hypothetical protein